VVALLVNRVHSDLAHHVLLHGAFSLEFVEFHGGVEVAVELCVLLVSLATCVRVVVLMPVQIDACLLLVLLLRLVRLGQFKVVLEAGLHALVLPQVFLVVRLVEFLILLMVYFLNRNRMDDICIIMITIRRI